MTISRLSLKQLVAQQFAERPTLRQVLGQDLLKMLHKQYPLIASAYPELDSADAFSLMNPPDGSGEVRLEPWCDAVLRTFLAGEAVTLTADHHLSLYPPQRFRAAERLPDGVSTRDINLRLETLNDDINQLLAGLVKSFANAQVEYWRGSGRAGLPRDRWMRQVLRMSLATRLGELGLDTAEVACLRGLLQGGASSPGVDALQVELHSDGHVSRYLLADLLVSAELDEQQVVLWCPPSGLVQAFTSLAAFEQGLNELLAQNHAFDRLSWSRHPVEGDAASQQVALMLDAMLADFAGVRFERLESVAALESLFAELSAPSGWFVEGGAVAVAEPSLALPAWLASANDDQRFAYQGALLELALAQSAEQNGAAPPAILDLRSYASQRLREQMLVDHPDDANYFADDLLLTLVTASGVPGGPGTGPGGGEPLAPAGVKTLTDFAIGNLSSLDGAIISSISHRDEQLIMDWLTVDYLKQLVTKVDIGGRYPAYVKQQMDEQQWRSQRVAGFARQWRCRLLLDALQSRIEGKITAAAWQVLADFCDSDSSYPPRDAAIAQLALRREPGGTALDKVHGMYVIRPRDKALPGVLYRPFYSEQPLHEINGLRELLGLLQAPGDLQDSVLAWLPEASRAVYAHGGFLEPHLKTPIVDTSILPTVPKPPAIVFERLANPIDDAMYRINGEVLVELADRQSVSTAESRWALLTQGAHLLFDVAALLVPGPLGVLLWATQGVESLASDLKVLSEESGAGRSAAAVDLLLNVGLLLLHARQPEGASPGTVVERLPGRLEGSELRRQGQSFDLPAAAPLAGDGVVLSGLAGRRLDFAWTGANGLNALSPALRGRLRALRSEVALAKVTAETGGAAQGLYRVDGDDYVQLAGDAYRVRTQDGQWRVLGPVGEEGPYLAKVNGVWRVDAGIRAQGGALDVSEHSRQKLKDVLHKYDAWEAKSKPLNATLLARMDNREQLIAQLDALESSRSVTQAEALKDLEAKIAGTAADLRAARLATVSASEELHADTEALDKLFGSTPQLRYAGEGAQALNRLFEGVRGELRKSWLGHQNLCVNELLLGADFDEERALRELINGKPLEEMMADYLKFRGVLEEMTRLQARMIMASEALDRLIPQTLEDPAIVFEGKQERVEQFRRSRPVSTVTLRFRQAIDYANLALHLENALSNQQVEVVHGLLDNSHLRSAAYSHGNPGFNALDAASRIAVLKSAYEAYGERIVSANLLRSTGGELVEVAMLKRYKEQMTWLRNEAARALDAAIVEQELGQPYRLQLAYDLPAEIPSVLQTVSGQTVIGYPRTVDGEAVMQQIDHHGRVQGTLRRQGELWDEDKPQQAQPVLLNADLADSRAKAEALLGQQAWVIDAATREAAAYSAQGVGITLDGHIRRLRRLAKALSDLGDAGDTAKRIGGSVDLLEQTRDRLLLQVHTQTPWPTAHSLRYLHDKGLLQVSYEGRRQVLADGSGLDKYQIHLLKSPADLKGKRLWEAHLHYARQDDPATAFSKAHLKTWAQRNLAYREQLQSLEAGVRLKVYRGNLTLGDMQGIIPLS